MRTLFYDNNASVHKRQIMIILIKPNYIFRSDYNIWTESTKSSTTKKENTKETLLLHQLFKIIKFYFVKFEQDKLEYSDHEIIIIEWKELAICIERMFLVISLFAIILTPILLFGKFFLRDFITYEHLKSPCGCEHSFIKDIQ